MHEPPNWVPAGHDRKKILIRFVFTLLFFIVLEVLKTILLLASLVQFGFLFITRHHNEPLRNLSNKVVAYAYRVARYATLCDQVKPFPFTDFPGAMEPSQDPVSME